MDLRTRLSTPEAADSILVVVVILTAIIPTLIAQAFFEPKGREREVLFEVKGGEKDV